MKINTSSGFSIIEIILIIAVVGLLGALAFVYIQKSNDTHESQPQQSTTTNSHTARTKETPEGWQLYTNKELGFSIAHPSEFEPDVNGSWTSDANLSQPPNIYDVSFYDTATKNTAPLSITVTTDYTLKELDDQQKKTNNENPPVPDMSEVITHSPITIDSHAATRRDRQLTSAEPPYYSTDVYVEKSGNLYKISGTKFTKGFFDSKDPQTMLKSFEFIE